MPLRVRCNNPERIDPCYISKLEKDVERSVEEDEVQVLTYPDECSLACKKRGQSIWNKYDRKTHQTHVQCRPVFWSLQDATCHSSSTSWSAALCKEHSNTYIERRAHSKADYTFHDRFIRTPSELYVSELGFHWKSDILEPVKQFILVTTRFWLMLRAYVSTKEEFLPSHVGQLRSMLYIRE